MRNMLLTVTFVVLAAASPSPARAGESCVPGPLWKLSRGLVNVVTGLPLEIMRHGVGGATSDQGDTAGSFLTSFLGGTVTGIGYGVARMGSGIADMATFPIPFDQNNGPLLLPEFAL